MPQTQSRHDLNKIGSKKTPYFLLFIISLIFIIISLFAYNYTSSRVSKELAIKNIQDIYTSPTPTPSNQTKLDLIPTDSTSSSQENTPTPTPSQPYLKTYTSTDLNFKVDYMSTRQLFQDSSATMNRFVFVNPEGNFVVHVGTKDYDWTHSGRAFTKDFLLAGKQTFVFNTTSQKVIDLKTDDGLFYTLQCVHNGSDTLVSECQDFINSFSFLN